MVIRDSDMRLTQGGEPTFVSIDDMAGEEWNTAALGRASDVWPAKLREAARQAIRRRPALSLRPGQMVSRRTATALGLELLLAEKTARSSGKTRTSSPTTKTTLAIPMPTLSSSSRIWRSGCVWSRICAPAFEDAWYYMWKEKKLRRTSTRSSRTWRTRRTRSAGSHLQSGIKQDGRLLLAALVATLLQRAFRLRQRPWFLRQEHMFLLPAIRRWASVCRLISLPGLRTANTRTCTRWTRLRNATPCPRAARCRNGPRNRRSRIPTAGRLYGGGRYSFGPNGKNGDSSTATAFTDCLNRRPCVNNGTPRPGHRWGPRSRNSSAAAT